jgi:hypothetical protein
VSFPEGAAKTILDEIVSGDDVLRQSQRVTPKSGNEGFDFLLEITLDGSLLFLIEWCFSGTSALVAYRIWCGRRFIVIHR